MSNCHVCRSPNLERVLDLGPQPASSHFVKAVGAPYVEHAVGLAVCHDCGVVQLADPFPFEELVPPIDWITYREPEKHLDAVVDTIFSLPSVGPRSRAAGLSFKDASTLDRLRQRGLSQVWQIDLAKDLGAVSPAANIESVAGLLTPPIARRIVAERGSVDLLIARHVVEHATVPEQFLEALGVLLAPGGYLVIEVPDCRGNLERQDYAMIWEEHTLYFTPTTLPQTLFASGCECLGINTYAFAFENVVVMVGRKSGAAHRCAPEASEIRKNVALAQAYATAFPKWTEKYARVLSQWRRDGRSVAAYGAGHLTSAFINFHGFADAFAFVADDTSEKQGLFLPKSGLPIFPRDRLNPTDASACLFGLSPDIEDAVIERNRGYVAAGGEFHSMLVDSRRSLRRLVQAD
jgi:hypothetical protein